MVALLGAGGMGEVYRARDTKLNRDVAIKVVLPAVANDPDRLARFSREAQLLASLNHPNIAAIYGLEEGVEVRALVMELVEGPTLADQIARGPIPLADALAIARQIAEALEAAHEQGIVHRDLKPANIKVRPDGTVKVLDFGLAKAIETGSGLRAPGSDAMNSPTLSIHATEAGLILGTAAYMSPEQARGKAVDKRTDIWAFGCVLYEMLTGRRPFAGDDVSDVLASVLAREPDLAALPASTPLSIRRLVRRCLQKDRNERLRDIGDAQIEIRDALTKVDGDATVVAVPAVDSRRGERLAWLGALVAMALAVAVVARRPDAAAVEMRLDIITPPTTVPQSVAISPDGRTIAFVATSDGQSRVWLRSLESGSARAVVGTDGAESPFWSADGRSVGFFTESKLMRVDVEGGLVQTVANASGGLGGTWNRDGVILFAMPGTPIFRVSASGGEPVAIPGLAQQGSIFSPQFLPDGRRFLYYVRGRPEVRGVYVGQLDPPLEPRRLIESDTGAVYAPSGHLLFIRAGTLVAQTFDPVRLELSGSSFAVAEQGMSANNTLQRTAVSVSGTGTIAFRTRSAAARRQFVWFDRSGKELGQIGESVNTSLNSPSLSPDGQRVALYRGVEGANPDIWLFETKRGVFSRFTTDAADDVGPVWSPAGDRIVFSSNRSGIHNLFQKAVAAGGSETLLLSTAQPKFATDWSSDGRFVLFHTQHPKSGNDVWAFQMNGNGTPFAVVQTSAEELSGQFSPDGRWVAYQSDESGRVEVYVQPFPGPGSKWPISTNGGSQVRWRHDGKELFYVASDGRLMAASIQAGPDARALDIGTPVALFAPPFGGAVQQGESRPQYMVSPDGRRFLVSGVTEEAQSPITVILNWSPATAKGTATPK